MSSDIVSIRIDHLSKRYEVYAKPVDRLKQMVVPRVAGWLRRTAPAYFHEFWALRDVSFAVHRGETIGIIGRNGAGKSTLLQVVAGTLTPTSGSISVEGRVAALLELGSGFNPEFTGRENVYLNGAVLGLTKEEVDERFQAIAEFADIGDFIEQPVKTYSSGMYVRLAFAVVAHLDPKILIVDEALSVGDFIFQQKCARYMHETLAGITKIIVSHDLSTVAKMADRVVVMHKGKVAYIGATRAGIAAYERIARASAEGMDLSPEDLLATPATVESAEKQPQDLLHGVKLVPIPRQSLSGTGKVEIKAVCWSVGNSRFGKTVKKGERVSAEFVIDVLHRVDNPIVGYQVQDRHGQIIFGDNTVSSGFNVEPLDIGCYRVRLDMIWPQVAAGEYGVTLGVGNGYGSDAHIVECWAHNVVVLGSIKTDPQHGVFNNRVESFHIAPELVQ